MPSATNPTRLVFRGVVFREGSKWVARCLTPVDHAAQADTPQAAMKECAEGVAADIVYAAEHGSMDALRPAPLSELLTWLARIDAKPYRPRKITLPSIPSTGLPTQCLAEFGRVPAMA